MLHVLHAVLRGLSALRPTATHGRSGFAQSCAKRLCRESWSAKVAAQTGRAWVVPELSYNFSASGRRGLRFAAARDDICV